MIQSFMQNIVSFEKAVSKFVVFFSVNDMFKGVVKRWEPIIAGK
jgi:hypothetical protein